MFVQRKIFSTPFCHTSCTTSTLGECLRGFFALFIGAKIITKATTTRKFAYCREPRSIYCATNRVSPRCSQNKTDKNSNRNSARVLAWWGVLRTQADNKQLVLITLSKNQIKYLFFITIIKLTVYIFSNLIFHFIFRLRKRAKFVALLFALYARHIVLYA